MLTFDGKVEGNFNKDKLGLPKFELNQQLVLMYQKMRVPSVITKRIKVENIDTCTYEYYYDYKHDIPSGFSFTQVPEEHLLESYREALDIGIKEMLNKKEDK